MMKIFSLAELLKLGDAGFPPINSKFVGSDGPASATLAGCFL